jgi:hypothetical protein
MKKSEMLKVVQAALQHIELFAEQYPTDEQKASFVLEQVEKAGMLPPSFFFSASGEYGNKSDIEDLITVIESGHFAWKPEEEKR